MPVTKDEQAPTGLGSLGYRLSLVSRQARLGFERRLAEAGASFATWTVLETLVVRGPMIQRELAASLEVSGQTMTRHIDRMVTSGWLRRRDVESDRRSTLIEVTKEGKALHRKLVGATRQANEALTRGLTPHDLATLDRLLNHLADNVTDDA